MSKLIGQLELHTLLGDEKMNQVMHVLLHGDSPGVLKETFTGEEYKAALYYIARSLSRAYCESCDSKWWILYRDFTEANPGYTEEQVMEYFLEILDKESFIQ